MKEKGRGRGREGRERDVEGRREAAVSGDGWREKERSTTQGSDSKAFSEPHWNTKG